MKNLKRLIYVLLPLGVAMTSCEGPMGPSGVDANQSCTECHNNSTILENKEAQWEESIHAKGENAAYANRTGCVQCHTSQGFLESVAEGSVADISLPDDPMQINCYTCHQIHQTFTSEDYALTKPAAQTLETKYAGTDVIWDRGSSNQCAACHQARAVTPLPVRDGADFAITNSRVGAHHAPNTNLLLGKIPFELTGNAYPTSNPHLTDNGCVDCHMAKPYGYLAGGHNMNMTYDAHGVETLLTNGCIECHTATEATSKYNALKGQIADKLADLQAQLTTAGIYNSASGLARTGTFKANAALAYLTYNTVAEDRSNGMHNPFYIKTLLDNAITSMTALGYPAPAK
jgi:hypothetical protein